MATLVDLIQGTDYTGIRTKRGMLKLSEINHCKKQLLTAGLRNNKEEEVLPEARGRGAAGVWTTAQPVL